MYKAADNRYETMKYRRSGASGLLLPEVSLGLWHNFGDRANYQNMKELCFTAFDNGITHFDLANNYGPEAGSAEKNFGRILKEDLHTYRDELIISTKAGYTMWAGPYGDFGSRKYLLASLDQSLKMGALSSAVNSGKALYVGLSNYDGETLEKASKILEDLKCPFIINQNRYSIFDRTIENNGLKNATKKVKKGLIVFSPLAQGQLSDRYLNGIPKDSRIMTDGRFLKESNLDEKRLTSIRKLNELASSRGESLASMALSWVLEKEEVSSVLIGASKPEQIIENIKAINSPKFTKEELEKIDDIAL